MEIAERIQKLRKARGMSQEELADRIGVSRQAVSKWESSQSTPDIEKIILLSECFEVTTDYLLKGIDVQASGTTRNAVLFSMGGTIINAMGLILAVTIWIERQMAYSVGAGLIVMLLGTFVFLVGQVTDSRDKEKARRYFILPNTWILLLMPLSCCLNILDGLWGGYWGQIAPLPILGNSLATLGLRWAAYIGICVIANSIVLKKK